MNTWIVPLCHLAYGWHDGSGRRHRGPGGRFTYGFACRVMRACQRRGIDRPLDIKMTPEMLSVYRHLEEAYIPAEWRALNEKAGG
jgi:hypothetical protein